MLRSLIRSVLVAVFVLALSMPAHALPLGAQERDDFVWSLSALWERLVSPIAALWTGGSLTCKPGGSLSTTSTTDGGGATTQGAGACDPNG
jgi:hypothetical protein